MGRSSKLLLFRKAKTKLSLEESNLIVDGLVRLNSSCNFVRLETTDNCLLGVFLGNTRVISQTALDHFRTSLSARKDDPYSVLLRRNKLPMALLDDAANPNLRKVG